MATNSKISLTIDCPAKFQNLLQSITIGCYRFHRLVGLAGLGKQIESLPYPVSKTGVSSPHWKMPLRHTSLLILAQIKALVYEYECGLKTPSVRPPFCICVHLASVCALIRWPGLEATRILCSPRGRTLKQPERAREPLKIPV